MVYILSHNQRKEYTMASPRHHVRALLAGTFLALVAAVHAEESVIYVVPSNPNAAAPYDTWETASDDIVSAINNAAAFTALVIATALLPS